ncbi:hypothetical protein NQ318_014526 [Aromia moschata]|uniref:Uncharacterized protein n=1 Tax=Aromia moschata TaxID=1265417 RepID=A0AAV8YL19_9CUCU|nr:hypothetical protein NQ318_014526 [Aromia moschata]
MMVKSKLDGPSFTHFTNALSVYKETLDLNKLTEILDKIFTDKPSLRFILLGLETWIKDHHKDEFQKYCEKMR